MEYTRANILKNRENWVARLLDPASKGTQGYLEFYGGFCCLGHACVTLGLSKTTENDRIYYFDGKFSSKFTMPGKSYESLGLVNEAGGVFRPNKRFANHLKGLSMQFVNLANWNDHISRPTPQDIGDYLQSVIEGGPGTPFIPLDNYPETL